MSIENSQWFMPAQTCVCDLKVIVFGVSDLSFAPERILEKLSQLNGAVARVIIRVFIRKPRIRLVQPGTFSDFLQLKLDEGNGNLGQIKVPVVLPKEYVAWFSKQVVQQL